MFFSCSTPTQPNLVNIANTLVRKIKLAFSILSNEAVRISGVGATPGRNETRTTVGEVAPFHRGSFEELYITYDIPHRKQVPRKKKKKRVL